MNLESHRRQWLRYHRRYERRAYLILRRAFIKAVRDIDLTDATQYNYQNTIKNGIARNQKVIQAAYVELYTNIGLTHGRRVLKAIEKETKSLFSDTFEREVMRFLFNYGGNRIVSVSQQLADFIIEQIAIEQPKGQSISQIVTNILKKRSFYRWQLLRIARTETTAAAGYASDSASSTSGIVLEKVWVSATDSRTRVIPEDQYDHLNLNGVRVDDGQPFKVAVRNGGFELLRFPGDPSASAGNTINCRCSVVKVPKRDANGNIMRRF